MTIVPRLLRRLARDQRGAVAVTLALSLIPLSLAALGAVDLTRAVSARSQLQDALDAATLYAARTVTPSSSPPSTDDNNTLQAAGDASWGQNLKTSPDFVVQTKTFVYPGGDPRTVQGDATASVNTILVQALTGGSGLTIKAHSEVTRGGKNVEVALVLDRTGSMDGAPLKNLKLGATDFVNTLITGAPSVYTTKISIVPYTVGVNVGPSLLASVRLPTIVDKKQCPDTYACDPYKFTPASGGPKLKWDADGCVTERTDGNAFTDAGPGVSPFGFHYPDPNDSNAPCPSNTLVPLTSVSSTLTDSINALVAGGSTAGHIGLAWGWYTLAPNFKSLWPNSAPADYGDSTTLKVLVLMTDGEFNTAYHNGVLSDDSSYGNSSGQIKGVADNGTSATQAATLCTNIKAKGIVIYTVGYGTGLPSYAKTLLQNCATDTGHVYFPQAPSDLKSAFDQIAQAVSQLRLSK